MEFSCLEKCKDNPNNYGCPFTKNTILIRGFTIKVTLLFLKWTPLLLILGVGVVLSKNPGNHSNQKPIGLTEDEVRICADLCSSGLGGENCGKFCKDLMPKSLQQNYQFTKDLQNVNNKNNLTRSDACPILCKNGLGDPFCKCKKISNFLTKNLKSKKIDFKNICEYYCNDQHWWLHGCPPCKLTVQYGGDPIQNGGQTSLRIIQASNYANTDVDWNKWCDLQCANSNGGSACNCDLLPFSIMI